MKLKQSLFDDWPVPFRLEYGQVGRIYLKIPIWNLFSQPVIIQVQDVFGYVKLINIPDFDADVQKRAYRNATQASLEQFEIFEKQKKEIKVEAQKSQSGSYTTKLLANIIENIRIEVSNIYFRFEDKMSGDNEDFALGLLLKEFSVFNCNSKFERLEPHNKERKDAEDGPAYKALLRYKKIKISGFSVFCDWQNVKCRDNGGIALEALLQDHNDIYAKVQGLQPAQPAGKELDHEDTGHTDLTQC